MSANTRHCLKCSHPTHNLLLTATRKVKGHYSCFTDGETEGARSTSSQSSGGQHCDVNTALTKSPVCTCCLSISYSSAAHIPSKSPLEPKEWSTKCPLATGLQKESRTQEKQLSTLAPGGNTECCGDHHHQHQIKSLVQTGLSVGVLPSLGQSKVKLRNKENTKIDLITGFFLNINKFNFLK